MEEKNEEVTYEGFVTPSLILEGSDKTNKGSIIDPYAKTKDQDGLICGYWTRGFQDGLIHLWLVKPVAAICDERQGWINKSMLLKTPIEYFVETNGFGKANSKKQPEIDIDAGVVKW